MHPTARHRIPLRTPSARAGRRPGALSALGAFGLALVLATGGAREARAGDAASLRFEKVPLTDAYSQEGAAFADIDRDGHQDVIYGPFVYRGPDYESAVEIYPPKHFPNDRGYCQHFFSWPHDLDGDGWTDVVRVGLPGTPAIWYENPQGEEGHWPEHRVFPEIDNESPIFTDLTGDGSPEIVCSYKGRLGWVAPGDDPRERWAFHALSPKRGWHKYTHGLGVGDVNGDGRSDVLLKGGWWEQPASLEGDPEWDEHPYPFSEKRGGAQMFATDVDGDGDPDVITSIDAHGYGLSWYEQVPDGAGGTTFREHVIMGDEPEDSPHGECFSQLHAMDLTDVDGDGLPDLVTGKCWWAHNGSDPGARDPAVLRLFLLRREADGVDWVPVAVDDDSGVGRQVTAGDVDGDGRTDIVSGNKKGAWIFLGRDAPAPAAAGSGS